MEFRVFDLGRIDFDKAWHFQKAMLMQVREGILPSALIVCQHNPVITLGRQSDKSNIHVSRQMLEAKGIQVFEVERGGDVTYHGPGQIMAYPIFNLALWEKDIHLFLRQLEQLAIELLSEFGLNAESYFHLTGAWVGRKKIASIGIAIVNWINYHGLSINVKADDLYGFRLIRPCGLDVEMTCLESELNRFVDINQVKSELILKFKSTFSQTEIFQEVA
jgi:lipoate-protein ligase B